MSHSLRPHGLYTVHGILQASILEWVAFPFSRGYSQPRDRTHVSRTAGNSLPAEPQSSCKTAIVPSGVMRIESLQNLWAPASPSHNTTATQSFRVPCGSPDSQQTWANRSPSTVSFASSWHFALLLGNFHLKIHSKPWVVRAMTWLEMFLLLQPISSANKPCSGDTDRKRHLPSSITWRTLNLTIFLIL